MALSRGVQRQFSYDIDIVTLYSKANTTIYEGTILTFDSDGSVVKSGDNNQKYAGIADETKEVGASLTPIRVKRHGKVWLPWTNPTQADVGTLKISKADDAIEDFAASKTVVGRVIDYSTRGKSQVYVDTDDKG